MENNKKDKSLSQFSNTTNKTCCTSSSIIERIAQSIWQQILKQFHVEKKLHSTSSSCNRSNQSNGQYFVHVHTETIMEPVTCLPSKYVPVNQILTGNLTVAKTSCNFTSVSDHNREENEIKYQNTYNWTSSTQKISSIGYGQDKRKTTIVTETVTSFGESTQTIYNHEDTQEETLVTEQKMTTKNKTKLTDEEAVHFNYSDSETTFSITEEPESSHYVVQSNLQHI